MTENGLFALVRSTLLAGFAAEPGYMDVEVSQRYQPRTVGAPEAPAVILSIVSNLRYGALRREDLQPETSGGEMVHLETQWWETRMQIGGWVWRNPEDPNFLTQTTAGDIAKMASNILQSDKGLTALAVERVRPLRITELRNVTVVNDRDEYEHNPSFDVVFSYPEVRRSTTPPVAAIVPRVGRV